jgi:RNA polymerase sigma factor (sigma-70 family)
MLNDVWLIWRFRSGDGSALAKIYEDHRQDLLRIAAGLLNQASLAEDIVHDLFVQLAQSPDKIRLSGSLKSFLATCVVNRVRNANAAARQRRTSSLEEAATTASDHPARSGGLSPTSGRSGSTRLWPSFHMSNGKSSFCTCRPT